MRPIVAVMFLLMGCGASGGGPVVTDIVAVLNGDPDFRADFVRIFPENRAVVSDMIEALAMIGGSEWVVVDNRSTSTATRLTIRSPGSRRYDIAYRFGDDPASMFATMPRSIDDAEVGEAKIGYSIAHLSESGCEPLVGKNSGEQLPISSVSKLAVIGATLDAVDAGRLKLDDQLELQAHDRSLPSGTWHTLPIGAKRPVSAAMSATLLASDNTANDLLIRAVGRARVHDFAVDHLGHDVEMPFLTTVELFKLSWASSPDMRDRFISGDFQARLAILVNEVSNLAMPALNYDEEPVDQLRIQWFGRSDAMCATWARLLADPRWAELGTPLAAAPEFELQGWHSLAHKAGYAPGNRSFSGVAELECGAIVSYSGAVVFGDNSLDVDSAFFLANILTGESLTVEEALCG